VTEPAVLLWLLLLTALCGALILTLWRTSSRDHLLRTRLREEVVVVLRDDSTFQGLLYACDARTVVLRRATLQAPPGSGGAPTPVDGELLVHRSEIHYLQRP
jgi:small nuclear ribonucleoprotein (snRNP)-like protein